MKKNIAWLKEEIEEDIKSWGGGNPDYFRGASDAYENVKDWLNQLDEPEILSQEENVNIVLDDLKEHIKEQQSLSQNVGLAHTSAGNDTHYRQYDYVLECINDYEPSDGLQNLLVPKPELPVIPKFVADFIEETKKQYKTLVFAITRIYVKNEISESPNEEEKRLYQWMEAYNNEEVFARAWLDGFTVEEEQKYIVRLPSSMQDAFPIVALGRTDKGNLSVRKNRVGTNLTLHDKYLLTEQEIKDYDERYWPFAVKVEELEE